MGRARRNRYSAEFKAEAIRLLHHSDRGVPYASTRDQEVLHRHAIRLSMSRSGNCWDNSVVESFFSTLKTEPASDGYQSPADFEARFKVAV